jgi:hypothetical protein
LCLLVQPQPHDNHRERGASPRTQLHADRQPPPGDDTDPESSRQLARRDGNKNDRVWPCVGVLRHAGI